MHSEPLTPLFAPLTSLRGIGPSVATLIAKAAPTPLSVVSGANRGARGSGCMRGVGSVVVHRGMGRQGREEGPGRDACVGRGRNRAHLMIGGRGIKVRTL